MGVQKWNPTDTTHFCQKMRDFSVDNTVDVTDNVWKSIDENFERIRSTILEENPDWVWDSKQMKIKWKNILTDYYKVKKQNATTGETRRAMNVMGNLDELVPANSPMITKQKTDTTSDSKQVSDELEPVKKSSVN